MKENLIFITLFILANILFAGCMQVYKTSYNTMNSEHIVTADISYDSERGVTEIQMLDKKFETDIPFEKILSDRKFKYTLYVLSDDIVKKAAGILMINEK